MKVYLAGESNKYSTWRSTVVSSFCGPRYNNIEFIDPFGGADDRPPETFCTFVPIDLFLVRQSDVVSVEYRPAISGHIDW